MKAMIFAAGLGTRLRPLTDTMPKALVPVNGKPLLHHLLTKLQQAGCTHVVVNVHHHALQIIDYIATHNYGMHIAISDESEMLLDTGGGLRKAKQLLEGEEPILVHNVDILSNLDFEPLMQAHHPDNLATVVVSPRNTSRYLLFDNDMRMHGWTNINSGEVKPANIDTTLLQQYAFAGVHVVSPRIFDLMQDMPSKFSIIDFYLQAMAQHRIMGYVPQDFAMLDVGKVDSLVAAEEFIKQL
ncbi:MAG: nucleotidyltransferase family protein [Bacteroidaceae bacterium]|nr:nucleotidyltransferase family protein [Bacteroidaceae bacterium]